MTVKIPFGITSESDPLKLDATKFKLLSGGEPSAEGNTEKAYDGQGRFLQQDTTRRTIKHNLKYQIMDVAAVTQDAAGRYLPTQASGAPQKEGKFTIGTGETAKSCMIASVKVTTEKHWTLNIEAEFEQDADETVTHVDLGLRLPTP